MNMELEEHRNAIVAIVWDKKEPPNVRQMADVQSDWLAASV